MTEKETLQEQAEERGIETEGLTIPQLKVAIQEFDEANEAVQNPNDIEVEAEVVAPYDLSVLKNAENVRTLISYTNGRCGDDKVIAILDKVTRKQVEVDE